LTHSNDPDSELLVSDPQASWAKPDVGTEGESRSTLKVAAA